MWSVVYDFCILWRTAVVAQLISALKTARTCATMASNARARAHTHTCNQWRTKSTQPQNKLINNRITFANRCSSIRWTQTKTRVRKTKSNWYTRMGIAFFLWRAHVARAAVVGFCALVASNVHNNKQLQSKHWLISLSSTPTQPEVTMCTRILSRCAPHTLPDYLPPPIVCRLSLSVDDRLGWRARFTLFTFDLWQRSKVKICTLFVMPLLAFSLLSLFSGWISL